MPNFSDTQGVLLSGFPRFAAAAYLFAKIRDRAAFKSRFRDWLPRVTWYDDRKTAPLCFNVAFTQTGLRALGLDEEEMATFSAPFYEGMNAPHRSQLLGDVRADAPEHWRWGRGDEVDVVVIVIGKDVPAVEETIGEWRRMFCDGAACEADPTLVSSPPDPRCPDEIPAREHFGFRDGMSQPIIRELKDKVDAADQTKPREENGAYYKHNVVAAGEFLFGYLNCYEVMPTPPLVKLKPDSPLERFAAKRDALPQEPQLDFGCDGTYLVLRQMKQYVGMFWDSLGELSRDAAGNVDLQEREKLAAKIVGRWRNGAPLTRYPDAEPAEPPKAINDLLYRQDDIYGERCPIGAHVRRANPRDALDVEETTENALKFVNRHRIIRRGRPYGPWLEHFDQDDGQDRGFMFGALNVNLERQFEFIQNAWINNHKFDGLYAETDPLLGSALKGEQQRMFTIQAQPVRRRIHTLSNYVQIVGGGYFFLPSRPALEHLLL